MNVDSSHQQPSFAHAAGSAETARDFHLNSTGSDAREYSIVRALGVVAFPT
jgi:hypothetical protein